MDRNGSRVPVKNQSQGSLSARRAWIEIVAWLDYSEELLRRSPQGERG